MKFLESSVDGKSGGGISVGNIPASDTKKHGYLNLGLPSGVYWAAENLPRSTNVVPDDSLPTAEQFDELLRLSTSANVENGCLKLTGPNGNVITFPLEGWDSMGNTGQGNRSDTIFDILHGGEGVGYYWTRNVTEMGGRIFCRMEGPEITFLNGRGIFRMSIRTVLTKGTRQALRAAKRAAADA